jgi:hypothetical protein
MQTGTFSQRKWLELPEILKKSQLMRFYGTIIAKIAL